MQLVFVQWGMGPQLNQVKASGGCYRYLSEPHQEEFEKNLD